MRGSGLTLALWAGVACAADGPAEFWNRTSATATSLRLSHAGTGVYGDNLVLGAPVAHDGRAPIVGLPGGRYDVELRFKGGRACFLRHVAIEPGAAFSVDDKEAAACFKR